MQARRWRRVVAGLFEDMLGLGLVESVADGSSSERGFWSGSTLEVTRSVVPERRLRLRLRLRLGLRWDEVDAGESVLMGVP